MLVVGIKHIDYFSKKKDCQVNGVEIHYQYEDKNINGFGCGNVYLSDNVISKSGGYVPQVGDDIGIYYNQYKSPVAIYKVEG